VTSDAQGFFELAPCGFLVSSQDGTILEANDLIANLLGLPVEDLLGRTFASLLSVGGRMFHETHYAPMLAMHGEAKEIAFDLVAADGQRVPVLVSSNVAGNADPSLVRIRTVVFEARGRRTYEQELLRARRSAEESEARATELATTLQESFVPPAPPNVPGLEFSAAYRPAGAGREVGGDFYDIFQIKADEWIVALGDVSGKGVKAATVTTFVRRTIRALSIRDADPVAVLHDLNDALLAHASDKFCTVVLLHLVHEDGRWSVTASSGGHPLPLLRDADGDVRELGRPGSLVGAIAETSAHASTIVLDYGQTIVLYTDGVTEARHADGSFYGDARLVRVVSEARHGPHAITEAVLDDVLSFQHGDARDDIAIIAFGLVRT